MASIQKTKTGKWRVQIELRGRREIQARRARVTYEKECEAAGQDPHPEMLIDLRFHDLRHIATSRLAKFYPNVIELSMVTGHSDLKMLKRYYHTKPEDPTKRLP
jgi:integrase